MTLPALASLVLPLSAGSPAAASTVPTTVPTVGTISGTAYTFNTRNVIAGAEIRVAEHPELSATTGADGSYTLAVPAGPITPYIVADGHGTIYDQTFLIGETAATTAPPGTVAAVPEAEPDGLDLVGVNFQTPDTATYGLLRTLLTGINKRDPFDGGGCVIVTTVGDHRLAGMPFADFITFAPHGVAGAKMVTAPELPAPIYFNDAVIPDPAQTETSGDGGVIWANVPPACTASAPSTPTTTSPR